MIVTGVLRGSSPQFERSHAPAAYVKGVAKLALCEIVR